MSGPGPEFDLLTTGDAFFSAIRSGVQEARTRIRLEMYTFTPGRETDPVRDDLVAAAARGVRVELLLDFVGCLGVSANYWEPLRKEGGSFRWFNPFRLRPIRDHRKLLVCDNSLAIVGGFNLAKEYVGDGVSKGWFDLGAVLRGPFVEPLGRVFDDMYNRAQQVPRRFDMLRRGSHAPAIVVAPGRSVLLGGPGRTRSAILGALRQDLAHAREVRLIVAYFLPTIRLRHALQRVSRRGGRVELVLPGKSDVALSRLAARSLYDRLFRHRVVIHEYDPQILHAKLFIIDGAVYVGSCNLDVRSLRINFELMVRIEDAAFTAHARRVFDAAVARSRTVDPATWRGGRGFWEKLRERWSYLILSQLDPYLTRWLSQNRSP